MTEEEKTQNEAVEEVVPIEETEEGAEEKQKTWTEEVEVAGNKLVEEINRVVEEGNVRRLIIKQGDRELLNVPLTAAAVMGGATAVLAPQLAALGALAALIARVTIIIEREGQVEHSVDVNVDAVKDKVEQTAEDLEDVEEVEVEVEVETVSEEEEDES